MVLQPDDAIAATATDFVGCGPAAAFAAAPFAMRSPSAPAFGNRMAAEAAEWSRCRVVRLRLEEQLALQEEFRLLDAERAEELRGALSQIERRFGDSPVEGVLEGFSAVRRQLFDAEDEREWW